MVSRKVKLLNLEGQNNEYRLAIQVGKGKPSEYEIKVSDRDGIFGIDLPDDLGLLLRSTADGGRQIVAAIKAKHRETFAAAQAA